MSSFRPTSHASTWRDRLRTRGFTPTAYCIGIDEVGTGALAGPYVVAAVVCSSDWAPSGVRDSKKLSPSARESLVRYTLIPPTIEDCWVLSREANDLKHSKDLNNLMMELMRTVARQALKQYPDAVVVVDGLNAPKFQGVQSIALPKADDFVPAVSAASIIAKVHRDHVMQAHDKTYPHYGFARHVGYGTAEHKAALKKYGVCPLHRLAYRPVRELAGTIP
jgi:ribonuclease HII